MYKYLLVNLAFFPPRILEWGCISIELFSDHCLLLLFVIEGDPLFIHRCFYYVPDRRNKKKRDKITYIFYIWPISIRNEKLKLNKTEQSVENRKQNKLMMNAQQ